MRSAIPEDDIIDLGTIAQSLQKQYGDHLTEYCELVMATKGSGSGMIYENTMQAYLALQSGHVQAARTFLKVVSGVCGIRAVLYEDAKTSNDPAVKASAIGIDQKHDEKLTHLTDLIRVELGRKA